MTRPTWDQTFMNVAHVVSERSLCSRAQVGAVVVSSRNRIVSTGYNGPPSGMNVGTQCVSWCSRSSKDTSELDAEYGDCPAIHAEANALLYARSADIIAGTIYITSGICFPCAKLVANSGIARVVVDVTHVAEHRKPDYVASLLQRWGLRYDEMMH